VPAEVIATVMVLQALEGLSDREAISALRRDIAWKVACGLRLDDEGFHPTVLVYWRARLRSSDRPRRLFEAVGQVVAATGVLRGRRRRVLDSTVLADAVATQDTVTQLVAAIRRVRRLVPRIREVKLGAHDYDRPGKPDCAWDDPQATQALVSGLVNDAQVWRRSYSRNASGSPADRTAGLKKPLTHVCRQRHPEQSPNPHPSLPIRRHLGAIRRPAVARPADVPSRPGLPMLSKPSTPAGGRLGGRPRAGNDTTVT
jgi:Transposase domain (DUF772)